jgi:hypothetical protein
MPLSRKYLPEMVRVEEAGKNCSACAAAIRTFKMSSRLKPGEQGCG